MFKHKVLVSIISMIVSAIIMPFILGIDGFAQEPFNFKSYINSLAYQGLLSLYIHVLLIPVTFLAGFILNKFVNNTYKILLNLVIHLIPGVILLFVLPLSPDIFFLLGIPLFIGSIYFAVDELLQWKKYKFNGLVLIILVPFILWGVILFPSILDQAAVKKQQKIISETPIPEVEVTYNGEKANLVNLTDCWKHEESVCEDEKNPFLLPLDPTGLTEYEVKGTPVLEVKLKGTDLKYTIRGYYLKDSSVKKVSGKGTKITFPSDLQEQAVRIIVDQENNQKISFYVGFKTGVRD
jgi:hypothetical protein